LNAASVFSILRWKQKGAAMEKYFSIEKITELVIQYTPSLLGALFTLAIGFWIASRIARLANRAMIKRDFDPTIRPFIRTLISILLKALVLLSAASMFGLQVTSFIAILSAIAFAIGLALQGTLGHLASGILILIFKPFRAGDFIVTQSLSGTVKEIQLFSTIIITIDNRVVILPNASLTNNPVENLTILGTRRLDMTFGVSYSDNIDKTRSVLEEVAKTCPGMLTDQPLEVFVRTLNNSSVDFVVRLWLNAENYWPAFFYMQEHVKKAFDREGVRIPFPQMDVHMKGN